MKSGKGNQRKTEKRNNNDNDDIKAQTQSVTEIFLKTHLKYIDSDDAKNSLFKTDETNAIVWVEETLKKLINKNGSVGAAFLE